MMITTFREGQPWNAFFLMWNPREPETCFLLFFHRSHWWIWWNVEALVQDPGVDHMRFPVFLSAATNLIINPWLHVPSNSVQLHLLTNNRVWTTQMKLKCHTTYSRAQKSIALNFYSAVLLPLFARIFVKLCASVLPLQNKPRRGNKRQLQWFYLYQHIFDCLTATYWATLPLFNVICKHLNVLTCREAASLPPALFSSSLRDLTTKNYI